MSRLFLSSLFGCFCLWQTQRRGGPHCVFVHLAGDPTPPDSTAITDYSSWVEKDEAMGKLPIRMRKMSPVSRTHRPPSFVCRCTDSVMCMWTHLIFYIHINTHIHNFAYTCYKWLAGDYCISLSRWSLPLSSTSSNGRLILCCRICEPPLLSSPSTAAWISVNQVKIWLKGENGGRNKNVIMVHSLFTWMWISGIFQVLKLFILLSAWFQKCL